MKRHPLATLIRKHELKKIGEQAKNFRKSKNLTQEDVAKQCSLSQRQISMFEQGKNDSAYILLQYVDLGLIL